MFHFVDNQCISISNQISICFALNTVNSNLILTCTRGQYLSTVLSYNAIFDCIKGILLHLHTNIEIEGKIAILYSRNRSYQYWCALSKYSWNNTKTISIHIILILHQIIHIMSPGLGILSKLGLITFDVLAINTTKETLCIRWNEKVETPIFPYINCFLFG
jgi:hypothetical protein